MSNASFKKVLDEAFDLALKEEDKRNIGDSPKVSTSKLALEEEEPIPKIKGLGFLDFTKK